MKYFDRVSQDAYDWANSLFESSWANFMLKDKGYSKALGNIHTIQAPYFDEYIKPESVAEGMTVKATIYFYNCLYDRAEEAIGDFNAIYPDVFQELKKLITGTQDNGDLYEVAVKIRKQTSGLPEQVERAARGVLGDLTHRSPVRLRATSSTTSSSATTRPTPPGSRPTSRRTSSPI